MSDYIRITQRMRLANYSKSLDRNLREVQKRGGMELRDDVKQLLNVPGFQIRQKGETGTKGFVVRKGERVNVRDAQGRFLKGEKSAASRRSARGIEFRSNEINYDVARSRPGEPPRRQRGTLWISQTYEIRNSPRGATTRVGPTAIVARYARAQELGYPPGNLRPRPYLAPAAKAYQPRYVALVNDAVRRSRP